MELIEILNLLKIDEKQFLTLSKEDWSAKVEQNANDLTPNQKNELLRLSDLEGPQGRGVFFRNTLLENFPRDDSDFSPLMNFGLIRRFLGINPVQFFTMKPDEWNKKVKDVVATRRQSSQISQQDLRELDQREVYLLSLDQIKSRKQYFVNSSPQYIPLQKAANGTPANIAMQNEQNPPNVIAPQGADSPLYVAAGDKPKERKDNIKAILKEYREFMEKHYDEGLTPAERDSYGSKEDFLNRFKPKEATYFKSFEDLEKSEAFKSFSDTTKALYRGQAGGFPMNIIVLPFEKPDNGTKFIGEMVTKGLMKAMPAPKKEEEAEKTETATPPSAAGPK